MKNRTILCAGLFSLGVVATVEAATILNHPSIATELTVRAISWPTVLSDTLFPTALPYSEEHDKQIVASNGVDQEISSASYDLNEDRFQVDFEQIGTIRRTGFFSGRTEVDGAEFSMSIRFSVDVETPYAITGHYDVTGDRNKWFWVRLSDGGTQFSNLQESNPGPTVQNFVLGETGGSSSNELIGSMTGILNAGTLYTLSIAGGFFNQVNITPPATGIGSGAVTLFLGAIVPIPLPPAILLLTSGFFALIFRRRVR